MADQPGEVTDVISEMPKGRAAHYTLNVTSAFNIELKTQADIN